MSTINDSKALALADAGFTGNNLPDNELAWLQSTGATSSNLNDAWLEYLEGLGYTTGTMQDRLMSKLIADGYTGTLSDMLSEMYKAGLSVSVNIADVFSVDLYTGNQTARTITNGVDLDANGGMVWLNCRSSNSDPNRMTDTVRGVNKSVNSDDSGTELTSFSDCLTAFNSDGFDLGVDASAWGFNRTGKTYAAWTFGIASKFFNAVAYSGNSTVGREIPHGLGIQAGLVIIKRLDGAGVNWNAQHRSRGGTKVLLFDTNSTEFTGTTYWNDVAMDDTNVTFSDYAGNNNTGNNYIMYAFAHDPSDTGVIQCGEYAGNGSANGVTVDLGWKPQYVMIKRYNISTGSWVIFDTTRGESTTDAELYADSSAIEVNNTNRVEFLSNGFRAKGGGSITNDSGSDYIYMAIREEA